MMRCDILTTFPEMVEPVLGQSILNRAREKGHLEVRTHNLRDFTTDRHRITDDQPFGGGGGMVMKPGPILAAIERLEAEEGPVRILMMTPQGRTLTQPMAQELSQETRRIVFICGHYEGIDDRVRDLLSPEEVSIGDYVLTGGELPALVVIDAAVRLIPGVLGDAECAKDDSFSNALGVLDHPHYTRPAEIRGVKVPDVLRSGDHGAIRQWRRREALYQTWMKRPDLLDQIKLSPEDEKFLEEVKAKGTDH
jgi:tRNA (guanine37-N1)-methyltransferase